MNYICTWLYADMEGDESYFPQTGILSSSQSHQNIYWKCLIVFFITSKRFNPHQKHILFTNVNSIPIVKGRNIEIILQELEVEIIITDFKYKTPKNYFNSFNNQFYEFSILENIVLNNKNLKDNYMLLDSDCIFIKPADELFHQCSLKGFVSLVDDCEPDYIINGLSRIDMKILYQELLGIKINELPQYHMGEFFLCNVENIRKIFFDFMNLFPELLNRNSQKLKKFNEEAHTLSYLYFKNNLYDLSKNTFIRRIWTNPVFYRNVLVTDGDLCIWHLPAEKTLGFKKLYNFFLASKNKGKSMSNEDFIFLVHKLFGIPSLSFSKKIYYFLKTYLNAIVKRISKSLGLCS